MNMQRAVTADNAAVIFSQAARERALAILSLPADGQWQSFKSRFLECDPNRGFFVLDYQAVNGAPLPELLPGQCVGVSFRHSNRKILFATVVEARGHYLLEDRVSVPAIRYRWPGTITELQRRAYYRTPTPQNMKLLASLWPGGAAARTAAQGSTLQVVTGTLANISCGGGLVRLHEAGALSWAENQTLGVELQLGDGKPPLLLNACARGIRHDALGEFCVALQFIGLEISVDGHLALERLAATVQRFHRLAVASGTLTWNRRFQR